MVHTLALPHSSYISLVKLLNPTCSHFFVCRIQITVIVRWVSNLTQLDKIKTSLSECKESGSVFHHSVFTPWQLRWWRICLQCRKPGFDPWVRKIPGEGNGNPLQYSFLVSPKDREEPGGLQSRATPSDTTEQLTLSLSQFSLQTRPNGIKKSCTLFLAVCSKFSFPFLKSLSHSDFLRLNRKGLAINCQSRLWT